MDRNEGLRGVMQAITALLVASAWCANAAPSEPRGLVLDTGNSSVIVLDTEKATVLETVSFEGGTLSAMVQVPGSRKLVVFDKGSGKETGRFGYHPTGKSSVHFLDLGAVKKTSRLELGWGVGPFTMTPDGKFLVAECPGYTSQKASETLPAELVFISTDKEQVVGRVPITASLERPQNLLVTSDGRTLIVFVPASESEKHNTIPAELRFFDIQTARLLGTLTPKHAAISAALSNDGSYLYLLDPGKPSDKADKNVNGAIDIVSVADRSQVGDLDVGSSPQGLIRDDMRDLTLILSDPAPGKDKRDEDGVLRVIKGADTIALSRVAHYPLFVSISPDSSMLYVVGVDCISLVDYSTFKPLERIRMGDDADRRRDRAVTEFAISPDGKRGFAVLADSSKVAVFDLAARKLLASVTTGRGSVRFMKGMTVALQNAQPGLDAAFGGSGPGLHTYTIAKLEPAHQSIVAESDSAYVFNSQTNDVTLVDGAKAAAVTKIPVMDLTNHIEMIPGGRILAVTGRLFLVFIDTRTNEKIKFGDHDWLKAGGFASELQAYRVSPSGKRFLAAAGQNVTLLDLTTMKVLAKLQFKEPRMILFERE